MKRVPIHIIWETSKKAGIKVKEQVNNQILADLLHMNSRRDGYSPDPVDTFLKTDLTQKLGSTLMPYLL